MEKIKANIFVETVYPGVNVGCIITQEGAICVDTPLLPGEAQRWMGWILSQGVEQVTFVIYTSGQRERILGTQYLIQSQSFHHVPQSSARRQVLRSPWLPFSRTPVPSAPDLGKSVSRGVVVAHRKAWDQVMDHCTDSFRQSMVETFGERDPDMVKLEVQLPQITLDESVKLYVSDVTVTLLAAATGTLWVWLPEQRVLFTGDTVVVSAHPLLVGIDIQEWMVALERLRSEPQFQDAVVVPGRGSLCDTSAVRPLMEYLGLARDKTRLVYQAGRPKADLNATASELLLLYPVADGQRERVQRQIKLGLDELYDGFKAADAATE